MKRRGLDVLIVDSESPDASNAAAAAAATAAASGAGAYDMIIGTAVLESICNHTATPAPSFFQWDSLAALHLRHPCWLRCTLQGCCITLSGTARPRNSLRCNSRAILQGMASDAKEPLHSLAHAMGACVTRHHLPSLSTFHSQLHSVSPSCRHFDPEVVTHLITRDSASEK